MTHPLIDAGLELDCALRSLLQGINSPRCAQRVRDAAADVRGELLALTIGAGNRPITIGDVRAVLEAARLSGVSWTAIADAVRNLQGE